MAKFNQLILRPTIVLFRHIVTMTLIAGTDGRCYRGS